MFSFCCSLFLFPSSYTKKCTVLKVNISSDHISSFIVYRISKQGKNKENGKRWKKRISWRKKLKKNNVYILCSGFIQHYICDGLVFQIIMVLSSVSSSSPDQTRPNHTTFPHYFQHISVCYSGCKDETIETCLRKKCPAMTRQAKGTGKNIKVAVALMWSAQWTKEDKWSTRAVTGEKREKNGRKLRVRKKCVVCRSSLKNIIVEGLLIFLYIW